MKCLVRQLDAFCQKRKEVGSWLKGHYSLLDMYEQSLVMASQHDVALQLVQVILQSFANQIMYLAW